MKYFQNFENFGGGAFLSSLNLFCVCKKYVLCYNSDVIYTNVAKDS